MRAQVPLKHWQPSTELRSVALQKTIVLMSTVVTTQNLVN
jgi:hypothetical protein